MHDHSEVTHSNPFMKSLRPIILLLLLLIWGVVWVDISESTNSTNKGFTNLESNIAPLNTVIPEPTETLVPTETDTPVSTETPVPTETETLVPTETETLVPTETETLAPTETETLVPTETETLVPTETETLVPTETETLAPTETETLAPTETETLVPTETETLVPTATETLVPTETETLVPTETETLVPTETETLAPTETETLAPTETETLVPTETETLVPTETETLVPTETETLVPTATETPDFPTISISNAQIAEGDSGAKELKFTISRSNNNHANTIQIQTINGSANSSDFGAISGRPLNFPIGGALEKQISVEIKGDSIIEPDETFTVQLSAPINGVLGKSEGTGTILNDDSGKLVVTGGDSKIETDSGSVSFNFQAQLTSPVQGGFSVKYAVKDGSAKVSDGDFAKSSGTLTFSTNGSQVQNFNITVKGDKKVEGNESFEIDLTSSLPSGVSLDNNAGTSTIQNDDSATLKISGGQAQNEGDSGTKNYNFTVSLDNPVQGGFDVNYKTTGTTASAGSDFEDNDGQLSFAGGQNENRTITVSVKGDSLIEPDEEFIVELLSVSNSSFSSSIQIGTSTEIGVINNDDFAFITVSGGQAKEEGDSGQTEYQFDIELKGDVPDGFQVPYTISDISATSGEDYIDNDSVLNFEGFDGESQTVTVIVKGDTKAEAHEQFEFKLGEIISQNGDIPINISGNPQIGTITNDDGAVVFLDAGSPFVTEFDATKKISVTLSTLSQLPFKVDYNVVAGTASEGNDYSGISGTLNFAAGELVKVIEIPIIDDEELEGNESFTVVLSNPTEFDLGNPSSTVVTILDNDSKPVLNVSGLVGEVVESEGSISIDLVLSQPFALPVIATLNWNDGTARSGADYSPINEEVVFQPGETIQSIQLPIVSDEIYERNEDLTLEIVSVTNGDLGENITMLVKIIEDDLIPSFAIGSVTTNEAIAGLSAVEFVIEMSHLSEIDMFVDFETSDGSAVANEDYLPVSGRLRIRAGSLKGVVRVPILGDTFAEDDETFVVNFFNRSEGKFDSPDGVLSVTGVIKNVEVKRIYFPIIAAED